MPKPTLKERIYTASRGYPGDKDRPRAPKLPTLARYIQETWPDLYVVCEPWTTSTDRKVGRLRWPGRGRKGYRLRVYTKPGRDQRACILDHESGETYRHNGEVCEWIVRRHENG